MTNEETGEGKESQPQAPAEISQVCKGLDQSFIDLHHLITAYEKGAYPDLPNKIRALETSLENVQSLITRVPDLGREESRAKARIYDLYRSELRTMSSPPTQAQSQTIELAEKQESDVRSPAIDSKNDSRILCLICSSTVINANVGSWTDISVDLPLARQKKGAVDTEKEPVSGFWAVKDMFDFENVGFTHSVDGIKYLTCADCEYGPIGFVEPVSKLNLICPARLKYA